MQATLPRREGMVSGHVVERLACDSIISRTSGKSPISERHLGNPYHQSATLMALQLICVNQNVLIRFDRYPCAVANSICMYAHLLNMSVYMLQVKSPIIKVRRFVMQPKSS